MKDKDFNTIVLLLVKISAISWLLNNSDFQSYKNYKWRRIAMQLLQKLSVCSGTFVFHLSVHLNCILSLIYISHLDDNIVHTDAVSHAIIHVTLSVFSWHGIKVEHILVNRNKHQGGWVPLWMKTNGGKCNDYTHCKVKRLSWCPELDWFSQQLLKALYY